MLLFSLLLLLSLSLPSLLLLLLLSIFEGIPAPTIIWTRIDGTPLSSIPTLRQIRKDLLTTQLIYHPFNAANYRQDVHSSIIRCVATNPIGSIQSQDVHIRASKFSIKNERKLSFCFIQFWSKLVFVGYVCLYVCVCVCVG